MYTLNFLEPGGDRRYEIISQGFLLCRSRPIGLGEWDTAADLSRKIKTSGTPSEKAPDGTQLYDLNSAIGVMMLTKSEMKLLVELIENVSWKPATIELVVEVREWLKNAKWEMAT